MASWLSGFAEKAEELLNRVDQSAAAVVEQVATGTPSSLPNSSNPPSVRIPPETPMATKEEGGDGPSGPSSNISSVDYQANVGSESAHLLTAADMMLDPPSSASSSSYAMISAPESTTPIAASKDSASVSPSSSSAEVVALRGEVQLLSQELHSVTTRARKAQRELQETESKLRAQNEQLHSSERRIRDLEAQEADHLELLKVRETQLDAAKTQLDELSSSSSQGAVQLAASDGIVLQRLRDELQRSQQKSTQLEEELASERRKLRDLDLQLVQVKGETESDRETVQSRLADLERRLAQQRTAATEASSQLRHWQTEADHAKQELAEYKEKAGRVLQSKERLIASLQSNEEGGAIPAAAGSLGLQVQQLTAELEEIRSERDWLRDELATARLSVETLRSEQRELEAQLTANNDTATERAQVAADALQTEHRQRVAANAEVERWRQAAESADSEIVRTRADFESKVVQLEQEVVRLRALNSSRANQSSASIRSNASTNQLSSVGDAELVARLQALTENLVQKQLVVETVTAEKNSMAAQLDRMERQYRDLIEMSSGEDGARPTNGMVRTSSSNVLISGLNDEMSTRLRPGSNSGSDFHRPVMRESAFDSPVARIAKRIVNQVDRFAVQTSVVFRRFPLARPFLLVYMTFLHLWVTFLLLTYQPEIHFNDDLSTNPAHGGVILPPNPVDSVHGNNNQVALVTHQQAG